MRRRALLLLAAGLAGPARAAPAEAAPAVEAALPPGWGAVPPPVEPPGPAPVPVPAVHHLADGTPVWVVERHDLPLVRVEVSLGCGWLSCAGDPAAARVLGAVLGEGPRGEDPAAWRAALGELGAEARLGVGAMRAWADVETLAGTEGEAVALVARAFRDPALRRRDLVRARRRATDSHRHAEEHGAAVLSAALARAVYPPGHPLARVDRARDFRRVGRGDLRRAHRAILARGAPSILVVGDTTWETVRPALEEAWSGLPGTAGPPELPPPPPRGPRVILVDLPGLTVAALALDMPAPGAFTPELPAVELLAELWAGAFGSRLNLLLRERLGLAYGVDGRLRVWPGHGRWQVTTTVAPGAVGEALDAMHGELWALAKRPPEDAEVEAARRAMFLQGAAALGSLESLAFQLGVAEAYGRPATWARDQQRRYAEVSAEAVREAARRLTASDEVVWVVVGDRFDVEPALEAAGWTPDLVWSAAELFARPRRTASRPVSAR